MSHLFVKKIHEWQKNWQWWANLAPRERQILSVGSLLLIIFIIYQWIWSPMLDQVISMRKHFEVDQNTLLWMQAADKEMRILERQSKHHVASLTPIALLTILQNKINHSGLSSHVTQLKQASQDTITIQFQQVEFDALIRLLISMMKEQVVTIAQLSIIADHSPGVVNVYMTIQISQ
jgi:type II secretory pathway component PulM